MRRPISVLSSSLAAIGLSASVALSQQSSPATSSRASASASPSSSTAGTVDPAMANRPTRYLLRNGLDYLAYQEYARALSFLKAAEGRQKELNESEIQSLKKGIAQAQQGMREAVNSPRVAGRSRNRTTTQPGALALAKSAKAPLDAIERTSVDLPEQPATPIRPTRSAGPKLPAPIAAGVALPDPEVTSTAVVLQSPSATPAPASAPASGGVELPPLPDSTTANLPELPTLPASGPILPAPSSPTVDPSAMPAQTSSPVELPTVPPTPLPAGPPPPLVLESSDPSPTPTPASTPVELPPPTSASTPVELPLPASVELPPPTTTPSPVELPLPASVELPPPSTTPPTPMPVELPAPTQEPSLPALASSPAPPAVLAEAAQRPDSSSPPPSTTLPEPPPAAEAPPAPETRSAPTIPTPASGRLGSTDQPLEPVLSEKLRKEIEEKYRREVEQIAQGPGSARTPGGSVVDPNDPGNIPPSQGSTRLEIQRAPSPTEARPLRRIPIPEEHVNLGKREWDPNRKYWAAAGTCHMILYFQDPVLERYGQSVEQSLGPWGRFFSYPLDDPRQSNQRNQILQPFYSMGKLCFQVGTLPYKLVVDPPWESEYDLGYYRPGDRIPPDTIYITPTGIGPPLKGRNY